MLLSLELLRNLVVWVRLQARIDDLFDQFLQRSHYRAILRRSGQPRALRNVAKLLADIHASELVSVAEFLEYSRTPRDSGTREGEARATSGGAVQIMSIHAAKGLEFPVVVLGDAVATPVRRPPQDEANRSHDGASPGAADDRVWLLRCGILRYRPGAPPCA